MTIRDILVKRVRVNAKTASGAKRGRIGSLIYGRKFAARSEN